MRDGARAAPGVDGAGDATWDECGLCAACGCSTCAVAAELGEPARATASARLPAVLRTRYPFLPP